MVFCASLNLCFGLFVLFFTVIITLGCCSCWFDYYSMSSVERSKKEDTWFVPLLAFGPRSKYGADFTLVLFLPQSHTD